MLQPACSIPARITASAISSPALPQPSDRAASAARRPISAAFSCAIASQSPHFALRRRGRLSASSGPGLADLLVHLRDLLADRRELRMPGDLPPHLLHLPGSQLPANGAAPPGGPGPQEPRPVARMIRLSAPAVRLPALAVVHAHRPTPEITDRAELRIQAVRSASSSGSDSSVMGSSHLVVNEQPDSLNNCPDAGPLHMCRTPDLGRRSRKCRWPRTQYREGAKT